jgi:hypothetical protein
MNKHFWIAAAIAVLAAFFASTHPDGLDFTAEKLGFAGKSQERNTLMTDYRLKYFPEGVVSTALAGIAGILITLGVFQLTVYIIKKRNSRIDRKVLCLTVFWLLIISPVFAARPLITDDFYTVPRGGCEIELGYASLQNSASLINSANLSLKRGILGNLDLGMEVPYTTSTPSGINDILLHAKWRFWEREEHEGMTARVDYKFNNADVNRGLGSGDNDFCCMLIYSKMFGRTKAHFNFGYVNVGVNAGIISDDYFAYLFALEHPCWGDRAEVAAECVINNVAIPNPAFIQLGARYIISSGFKLDAAYSFGLNSNSIRNNWTAGVHYEI